MLVQLLRILPLFVLVIALGGCEAPLPSTPPPTGALPVTGDPWTEWLAIANADPMARDMERAVALGSVLASTEGGLAPMVEFIGDPAVAPEKKIVAIICLTPQRKHLSGYEARLRAWTAADQDEELRKLSTHVLGLLDSPGALERMTELLDDSARPVREAAMGVMLSFHPERVQERLQAFWDDPETGTLVREQVILGMPPHLVQPFIGIYAKAATDLRLTQTSRLKSVSVLGQLGSREHLAILKQCIDNDPDDVVKERARGALALLEASTSLVPSPAAPGESGAVPPAPSGPPA